jgi:hypothetical protein
MIDSARIPFAKVTKFHQKHSRLNCVKPRVRPDNNMNVLRRSTVVPQQSQPFGMDWIMACDNARISIRAQVLAGIKAETGEPA